MGLGARWDSGAFVVGLAVDANVTTIGSRWPISGQICGGPMAKEQRTEKMSKKPKKQTTPPKLGGSDRPTPPVTSVMPKGKEKYK